MAAVRSAVKTLLNRQGYDIVSLPADRARGTVVCVVDGSQKYHFWVADRLDFIQREHWYGRIYEREELDLINAHSARRGVFVDIGANVGNHSIVAVLGLGYQQAIAFEPSAPQKDILPVNIALNGLGDRVTVHANAVSDVSKRGTIRRVDLRNIGRDRFQEDGVGNSIQGIAGDSVLSDIDVDFIKIDVEGHEMQVLQGLQETIELRRPRMLIELSDEYRAQFATWCRDHGYRIAARLRRCDSNENLIVVPDIPC